MLFNSQAENKRQDFAQSKSALLQKAAILWHFSDVVVDQCPKLMVSILSEVENSAYVQDTSWVDKTNTSFLFFLIFR